MFLKLTRKIYTDKSTIGELEVDGKFQCFTLEDVVRVFKIFGETAIPQGIYDISFKHSTHFNKLMPYIENVKGFTSIMLHWGNWAKNTLGCPLVGKTKDVDFIGKSKEAFEELWEKFNAAFSLQEHFTIEIIDTKPARII
jgi:hypothetical protein